MGPTIYPEAGDAPGIDTLFHIAPYNDFVLSRAFQPADLTWVIVTALYVVLEFHPTLRTGLY